MEYLQRYQCHYQQHNFTQANTLKRKVININSCTNTVEARPSCNSVPNSCPGGGKTLPPQKSKVLGKNTNQFPSTQHLNPHRHHHHWKSRAFLSSHLNFATFACDRLEASGESATWVFRNLFKSCTRGDSLSTHSHSTHFSATFSAVFLSLRPVTRINFVMELFHKVVVAVMCEKGVCGRCQWKFFPRHPFCFILIFSLTINMCAIWPQLCSHQLIPKGKFRNGGFTKNSKQLAKDISLYEILKKVY